MNSRFRKIHLFYLPIKQVGKMHVLNIFSYFCQKTPDEKPPASPMDASSSAPSGGESGESKDEKKSEESATPTSAATPAATPTSGEPASGGEEVNAMVQNIMAMGYPREEVSGGFYFRVKMSGVGVINVQT